ncbi:hypothetical protein BAUCODRAFT_35336 [Baudoinia panamericana UAMH 10762]|uniref:Uncharacterized protein n=1 Tax=Baudoinia panamericana (strain UAMH 10762) TaxID=717646 RepID=M2LM02_BAUPA|nr:uncharacterized protein BAUCODRAFT_35336 [Baudoinia panamericana UAMH 10762]EMC95352.1 hypothetical protein BAUCODRAFT_35336 [Baudoinia panamericana UAMH 10762]
MQAGSDLAPKAGREHEQTVTPLSNLRHPSPCVLPPMQPVRYAANDYGRHTGHDRSRADDDYYTSGSMSSGSFVSPVSSIEKDHDRESGVTVRDPEKAMHNARNTDRRSRDNLSLTYTDDEEAEDEGRRMQEQKAVNILLFLAGPCVLLSALNAAWTIISCVITSLTQPVRLCARRPTFGQQLAGLLGPALNLQLRCIHTPLPPYANEDAVYHTWMLVAVHLLSPFLSLGVMFGSWVLAFYWVSSLVVGDPAGMDKQDDGRETVLGLRRWWEAWLLRSVKEE